MITSIVNEWISMMQKWGNCVQTPDTWSKWCSHLDVVSWRERRMMRASRVTTTFERQQLRKKHRTWVLGRLHLASYHKIEANMHNVCPDDWVTIRRGRKSRFAGRSGCWCGGQPVHEEGEANWRGGLTVLSKLLESDGWKQHRIPACGHLPSPGTYNVLTRTIFPEKRWQSASELACASAFCFSKDPLSPQSRRVDAS